MRREVDIPALGTQLCQIGQGRLGAGQDHEIGVPGQRRAPGYHPELHVGLHDQRIEIVEVRDPEEHEHGNLDHT